MTEPTPTPEKQPKAPDSEELPKPADKTGFFGRVQQKLKPKPHPTEEQEIVISDEQT